MNTQQQNIKSSLEVIEESQNYEIHKRRTVAGQLWDMQVLYIKGEGYQATYFRGADPMLWSEACIAPEIAALKLDYQVDKLFGHEGYHYVKIGERLPVAIKGIVNAMEFAFIWNGRLMNPVTDI